MKVGYLGPKATFTELAVNQLFSHYNLKPYRTIPECIDAANENEIDFAVVPLENSLEGSVNITMDYLVHEVEIPIVGEITLPIRQHLMVHPHNSENWKLINRIYSHSHALAQCHKYLHKNFKTISCESVLSTAEAARIIKEHKNDLYGAIANELAAEEYGLAIVQRNIHDFDINHTRFVVLSRNYRTPYDSFKNSDCKTTIMVMLPSDQAGALHQVLSAFAWRKINLSKIESRPMKTGLGNYFFIIDINMEMDEILIPGAIAELEALGCSTKILGSYPSLVAK